MSQAVKTDFELDETQLIAIGKACNPQNRIVAVTGQAGTGKTTILKKVHDTFEARRKRIVLCAPTGKAAKRIQEATGIPAITIHRLLEYPFPGEICPDTGRALVTTEPKRDRRNPIDFDVVLADEYAMVNHEVHRNLIDALPHGGIIRVFGDANQLSPIETSKRLKEAPSPFENLLKDFEGITLQTIHRQADDSTIIENGNRIIQGLMPRKTEDFSLQFTDSPVEAVQDFVMDNLDDGVDFGSLENQIITCTNKGWVGTQSLNGTIQALLQPMEKESFEIARHNWAENNTLRLYVGDKVIYTVNNYGLGIFNGETGIVTELDDIGQVVIDLGDRHIAIPPIQEMIGKHGSYEMNPQKDIELAYVITTHKSQGSEYNQVCYVMNKSRGFNLNRKNFYTAISRARKKVKVITDQRSIQLSLYRQKEQVFKRK